MVDLTGEEDAQQSAEAITPGLATPVSNEGLKHIALGRGETHGNESAEVADEVSILHLLVSLLSQLILCRNLSSKYLACRVETRTM